MIALEIVKVLHQVMVVIIERRFFENLLTNYYLIENPNLKNIFFETTPKTLSYDFENDFQL